MPRETLPSLKAALEYGGVSKAQIARDAGCSTWTLYTYLDGRAEVPRAKRARLARAMGGDVDWTAYDQELEQARAAAQESPQEPPKLKAAGMAPRPAQAAPRARQEPAGADPIAGAWGEAPKPAQAAPRPRQAPPKAAPKPKTAPPPRKPATPPASSSGGWLSRLFADDGEDPFA